MVRRMIKRPSKSKPADRKHDDCQYAYRDAELCLVNATILPSEAASREVAQRSCGDAQDAANERAGEEVPVLGDGEVVGRGREYLSEGVCRAYKEGLWGISVSLGANLPTKKNL